MHSSRKLTLILLLQTSMDRLLEQIACQDSQDMKVFAELLVQNGGWQVSWLGLAGEKA